MPRFLPLVSPRIAMVVATLAMLPVALAGPSRAQTLDPGPQVLSFYSEIDDSDQPYAIYLPPEFDAERAYPLVVSLHGAGSNHRLNLRRVFGRSNESGENDVEASRYFPGWDDVDYIVASPLARGTMGYEGVAEADVYDMLEDVKGRFPIDENRIYLTGLSMGGGGTIWLGLSRPDIWAAIVPVCPAPPPAAEALAVNARNLPVHIYQGGSDPVVQPSVTRAWVDRLRGAGAEVEYTEYPGVGHNSWENAYADGQLFDWLEGHRRNAHPEHVSFVSDEYRYDSAYWVRLDALTPGTQARIDARFTETNALEISTSNLDGFTLELAGHPSFAPDAPLEVTLDGEAHAVEGLDEVSFRRGDGGWVQGRAVPEAHAKRVGSEGPMKEVFASRHLYVYGTADDPAPDEAARRQAEALVAAEWSVYRGPFLGRVMVFPRVVADRDVRPSDLETAHLVLFGRQETNALIQRFADRLPMHLSEETSGYGLTYVYPVENRYVLVSSGTPWWERPDGNESTGFSFGAQVAALTLPDDADFLFFDADGVIAEGRFDASWGLPQTDADSFRQSGVVALNGQTE